jgi:FkbM family methyltransferase
MANSWKQDLANALIPVARAAMRIAPSLRRPIWKHVVQGRLDWRSHPFVKQAHFGASFSGNTVDVIQCYIYYFGCWEPQVEAVIAQCLKPGDTFIDVGANIGYFTLLAASLVGPKGRVVAFEASSATFARLGDNIRRNGMEKIVQAVHAAVADREGVLTLHLGPEDNSGMASLLRDQGGTAEQVQAKPLGMLVPEADLAAARLIKIDVEGAEEMVVTGMQPILHKITGSDILMEVSPAVTSSQGILEIFQDAGWIPYEILPADSLDNYFHAPLSAKVVPLTGRPTRRLDILLRQKDRPVRFH